MAKQDLTTSYGTAPTELYIVKGARGDITPADSYDKAVEIAKSELATYLVGYNGTTRIASNVEDGIEMWWIEEQYDDLEWYEFRWNADGFVPEYTIERIY